MATQCAEKQGLHCPRNGLWPHKQHNTLVLAEAAMGLALPPNQARAPLWQRRKSMPCSPSGHSRKESDDLSYGNQMALLCLEREGKKPLIFVVK